jgi:lysophospholipase L1-like esterase
MFAMERNATKKYDFDRVVRNPQDTITLDERFLFENDYLHPNAAGYKLMGESVDVKLFQRKDCPVK